MNTLKITVRRRLQDNTSKEAFWAGLRSQYKNTADHTPDVFENRLRNDFARRLATEIQRALNIKLVEEYSDLREQGPGRAHGFRQLADLDRLALIARIAFTVEDLSYGSLKIELGVPDPDSVLELLGNNVELLEAVLDEYVPEAFKDTTELEADQFAFQTTASPALVAYAKRRKANSPSVPLSAGAPNKTLDERKQEGARFLAGLVRSPLIFPVLLIFFLWYVARQDMLAERQIMSSLMQTLLQEQTATLGVLKDLAEKSAPVAPEQAGKAATGQTPSSPTSAKQIKKH